MATKKSEKVNLEGSLKELEKLVEQMESGKLSLEESLKLYERGVLLTATCQKILDTAEQKVKQLTSKGELIDYQEP